jgi:hypothetical protein
MLRRVRHGRTGRDHDDGGGETRRRRSSAARNVAVVPGRGPGRPTARYAVGTETLPGAIPDGQARARGTPLTTDPARDPGAPAPNAAPSAGEPPPAPGVREQFGRVRDAATALARAHLALLKAELGDIVGQLKVISALAGVILAVALFAAQLVAIGGTLFMGEWLFGSIGWGVLHGVLVSVALIVVAAMVLVEAPGRVIVRPLAVALIVGIAVSVALGANLVRRGAEQAGTQLRAGPFPQLDPGWAPTVVGIVVAAVVVGLLGLIALGRVGGFGGGFAGLILGGVVGAFIGWGWAGLTFSWHGAVAIGLAVGLLAWIVLMPVWLLRAHVDPTARFRRLWPKESYETAIETKEWLESEWARRRAGLGRT